MKSFVCVLLLAAVVVAEPPLYRRFQRRELETGAESEASASQNGDAPYAPAGFKPTKEFNLPSRQEVAPPSTSYGVPDDSYGAPLKIYSAPQAVYGVPEAEYGVPEKKDGEEKQEVAESEQKEEIKEEVKMEEKAEVEKEKIEEEPKNDSEVVSAQGVYYVLLPNSQLQRVQFVTENDVKNMAYTARLQYRDEDRAPVYIYTAVPQYQTAAYVQLF